MFLSCSFFDKLRVFLDEFDVEHVLYSSVFFPFVHKLHQQCYTFIYMEDFPISSHNPFDLFPALTEIPQPPKQLFMRGSLPDPTRKFIVVVGSRNCTSYGRHVCKTLIEGLRDYPVAIVSGLAIGMDGCAHEAALEYALPTIAFPGSGLGEKVLYPAQHRELAQRILETGGAIVSEYKPDMRANTWTFPQRNRLMAGIADMIITVEAEEKSGTLVTARLGTEYNRIVGAVPGNITSPNSAGTNFLIKLGAIPITSPDDILRELGFEQSSRQINDTLVNNEERRVLDCLRGPTSRDTIISATGCDIATLNRILMTLEIKGLIRENLGLIERVA
jgi:DNA processing protein